MLTAPARGPVTHFESALPCGVRGRLRLLQLLPPARNHYPALDWGWLLNTLAELSLVAEPQEAQAGFAEQQQPESAIPELKRFLQDVWVVGGG